MSYLLHIDTSGDTGSVSLGADGTLVSTRTNTEARNHASAINLMIDEVMKEAQVTMSQLSAIVVCAGPGSYTGLRIGLATAKGFCYALDIPLILDNKLTLLAHQNWIDKKETFSQYITVLKARENEFFTASYDSDFIVVEEPKHVIADNLSVFFKNENSSYIITDCLSTEMIVNYTNTFVVDSDTNIDINKWLFYSYEKYNCNNIVNLSTAEPFYLKQVYTHN